jgi:hypothetical protein
MTDYGRLQMLRGGKCLESDTDVFKIFSTGSFVFNSSEYISE